MIWCLKELRCREAVHPFGNLVQMFEKMERFMGDGPRQVWKALEKPGRGGGPKKACEELQNAGNVVMWEIEDGEKRPCGFRAFRELQA